MKNGIYKSNDATYFIFNGKILIRILGETYKTTKHFMFGEWKEDLRPGMEDQFHTVYHESKPW